MLPLLLLSFIASSSFTVVTADDDPWGIYGADCLTEEPPLWNPGSVPAVPYHVINLDMSPHDRWRVIAEVYADRMNTAIECVHTLIAILGEDVWQLLLAFMTDVPDKLDEPYRSEIKAMADMTGIRIEELTLLNLFYEISKGCTSLVAKDINGKIYHARNLDFGLFFIWDTEEHVWQLTSALKAIVVQLEFVQGGQRLFKAVTFAGHLGILTGVRPGAYSLSTNTRFGSTLHNLIEFLLHGLEGKQFLLYANRDMMTTCQTFQEAKQYLETVPYLARGYLILGGTDTGVVITRSYNWTDHEAFIDDSQPNGWYVLETNYDWDKPDMYLDDRTIPGNKCMQQLGQSRVSVQGLFQVLSSKTTLNKATVYTSIMEVEEGTMHTIIQHCDDPCWFV